MKGFVQWKSCFYVSVGKNCTSSGYNFFLETEFESGLLAITHRAIRAPVIVIMKYVSR